MLTRDEAERLAAELWSRNNTAGDWAALLLRVAASAREAERKRCMAAVCRGCAIGETPYLHPTEGWRHRVDKASLQGDSYLDFECSADAIRRRAAGEGGGHE